MSKARRFEDMRFEGADEDLDLDALADDPCNAKHPTNETAVACGLTKGHSGEHLSTTGCAGSAMRWTTAPPSHPDYATSNYGWALWHLEQAENAPAPDVALVHATAANVRAVLAAIDNETSFGGSTWTIPPTQAPDESETT